ncbi:pleiotropic regulator 1 [Lingula anatina]|uniref:Pleiotropic regulator 1 n=1 Tax=Lingula anatina TaxID=7574 RepID=A0A1S3H111_LINAN|nr:pleiotropic regulator 1-like [Lingula anatina]XP_013384840.1 pleiotropic regulator 1 [Lingula anatina]|eukprot:XP_013378829.1 pleiotropic regulator 1-like [Lingula anatina]
MEEVQKHSVHTLVFRSLKRTHDMFLSDHAHIPLQDDKGEKLRMACKLNDEYGNVKHLATEKKSRADDDVVGPYNSQAIISIDYQHGQAMGTHNYPSGPGVHLTENTAMQSHPSQKALPSSMYGQEDNVSAGVHEIQQHAGMQERYAPPSKALVAVSGQGKNDKMLVPTKAPTMPKPTWHPPWKLYRVISGHHGWVRSIAVEPGNEWFATGSADRMIKIWDLASGTLKLSLTGHISTVRGIVVSPRQPYLFSCAEDKQVKCWDLEYNKVIRHYHGHLSAVHAIDLHPTIDILCTCGRDATVRVWDMRTKACIYTLTGHTNTVADVKCQSAEPQVISCSHDSTIRLWDLAAGKSKATLTNHKKSVRALALHPVQYTFASASPDNLKQWKFPDGNFIQNMSGHNAIINSLAANSDNVLVSGGDNGTMYFWDWRSGYNFQRMQAMAQPGSIDSEAGIFALQFDNSGTRLISAEADKTIKIYKEDDTATEETHPINWKPDILRKKRY